MLSFARGLQGLRHIITGKDVGRACGKIGQIRAAFREASATLKAYPFSEATGNILGSVVGISDSVGALRGFYALR